MQVCQAGLCSAGRRSAVHHRGCRLHRARAAAVLTGARALPRCCRRLLLLPSAKPCPAPLSACSKPCSQPADPLLRAARRRSASCAARAWTAAWRRSAPPITCARWGASWGPAGLSQLSSAPWRCSCWPSTRSSGGLVGGWLLGVLSVGSLQPRAAWLYACSQRPAQPLARLQALRRPPGCRSGAAGGDGSGRHAVQVAARQAPQALSGSAAGPGLWRRLVASACAAAGPAWRGGAARGAAADGCGAARASGGAGWAAV